MKLILHNRTDHQTKAVKKSYNEVIALTKHPEDAMGHIISDVTWDHQVFWVFYHQTLLRGPAGLISSQLASQHQLTTGPSLQPELVVLSGVSVTDLMALFSASPTSLSLAKALQND